MNPNRPTAHFGQPGFQQPIPQGHMMMSQGHMMPTSQGQFISPGQGQFMGQTPGHLMIRPQGFNNMMGMQMRPSVAPPSYSQTVGQRPPGMQPPFGQRPGVAPPSYNQALNQGFTQPPNSGRGQPISRIVRKSEEQIQKEKYFQQQQAKLKQFGKSASVPTLDPNKLVDSIFGEQTSTKPRVEKVIEVKSAATIEADDSFGDFLSSPDSMLPPPAVTTTSQSQQNMGTSRESNNSNMEMATQAVTMATQTQVKTEKKDLTKMMFESCDLTAPQKAKPFQKPSLKEINPVHVQAPQHHTSQSARRWDNSQELSELFIQEAVKDETSMPKRPVKHVSPTSKHPPKPPPWLSDDALLPPVYKQVLEACLIDGQISTERLYPILVLSGLPKEVLGQLWTLCNKTTPGQLVAKELYQLLAVIALTQNNYKVETLDIIRRCPHPPVPFLAPAGTPAPPAQQVVIMPQSPTQPTGDLSLQGASGLPVSSPFNSQGPPKTVAQIPVHFIAQPQGQLQGQPQGQPSPAPAQVVHAPVSNLAASFSQPQSANFPSHVTGDLATSMTSPMTSSPATLPVTQLPPAGISPGTMGNVVNMAAEEDDDFADFQAASLPSPKPGSIGSLVKDSNEGIQPPVKDPSKFVHTGTKVNTHLGLRSTPDLKHSTVENFFGSDDSSVSSTPTVNREKTATSQDEEYFDGYKSADSKPSDSTSQFSTDQSEGEDFKNFENYLDEFQRKKEQQEKESPLHRPISKFLSKDKAKSPSHFVKEPTTPVQKLPIPVPLKQPANQNVPSSDEFSDFADFQSAPVVAGNQEDQLKASASAIDLIGDEDKYAALRTLDFSSPQENEPDLIGETKAEVKPSAESDDNWADFQTASGDTDQVAVERPSDTEVEPVHQIVTDGKEDSDWADFEAAVDTKKEESDFAAFYNSAVVHSKSTTPMVTSYSLPEMHSGVTFDIEKTDKPKDLEGFQESQDDFADFQSSDITNIQNPDQKETGLINVKKERLDTSEILGLFKVKDAPLTDLKSRDDDVSFPSRAEVSISNSMNKLHGISDNTSNREESSSPKEKAKQKHFSEEDDFMKPPPLDDFPEDEHDDLGTYSRGYDFDDVIKPKIPEKKSFYGIYGVNDSFVVEGHKKTSTEPKTVSIEVTKDSDVDNDSDSASSKDNDVFRGKFGLGKGTGEDSQSIASLELVVNRSLQNVRDAEGGDNQSVSSNDFGNFEAGVSKEVLPESKSLDSLDLRREDVVENGSGQENSDKETKEDTLSTDQNDFSKPIFDVGIPSTGLPIIGDRYSVIMHDVPGSDKHAYEWQRCLDNCCRMIQDANNIFNSISSSSVCNEVIKSSQGSQYIQGVIEIYRVVCKIMVTMKKSGIHSDKLTQLLKDVDLAWNNLTAFLVGGGVMPDERSLQFTHGTLLDDDTSSQYKACGVCLLDVDMKLRGVDSDNDNAKLTYGGRQYHAPCANFWINCVDSTLPALKLPELL